MRMKKIHIVLSAPQMFGFMRGQGARLRTLGYMPTVISANSESLDRQAAEDGVGRRIIPIVRDISLGADLVTFLALCRIFHRDRPEAVMLSGPKAIFLGGMAAWLTAVPRRVAVYHGMRQEVMVGPLRRLLDICDRISFACADKVLVVSPSLGRLVVARGLVTADKVRVTGAGTANGVDCEWFDRTQDVQSASELLLRKLALRPGVPLLGFIGRITEDKGIVHLLDALDLIAEAHPDVVLLAVGPDEICTPTLRLRWNQACTTGRVIWVGVVADVRPYLNLISVHIFPSLREGFGLAVVEAAALWVPSVAFRVTGVVDAIDHGKTGVLVSPADADALAAATICYLNDAQLSAQHGAAARERVQSLFAPESTWSAYQVALVRD